MRPAVGVVVPFAGGRHAAERLANNLARLRVQQGDEVIVADNTEHGIPAHTFQRARVVRAAAERSSYHSRNAGARAAANEWILFLDADCRPAPDLLDAYFAQPPPERSPISPVNVCQRVTATST